MSHSSGSKVESFLLGFILILLGAVFLVQNFTPINIFQHLWKLWPLILVVLGVSHLLKWLARSSSKRKQTNGWTTTGHAAAPPRPRKRYWKEGLIVLAIILVGIAISSTGSRKGKFPRGFSSGSENRKSSSIHIERPLTLVSGEIIRLRNDHGSITVEPAAEAGSIVKCTVTAYSGSSSDARARAENVELVVNQEEAGTFVSISTPGDHLPAPGLKVEMALFLPAETNLWLDGRNGPVLASEMSGDIRVAAGGGRVEIRHHSGRIDVEAGRSDVVVEDTSGSVHLRGDGGNLRVADADGDVFIESRDGLVEVDRVAGAGRFSIRNGEARLNEIRGEIVLDSREAKIHLQEVGGPVRLTGHGGGASLVNCYDTVELSSYHQKVESKNIRRNLNIRGSQSSLILENTLGPLDVMLERGSLTTRGKLYTGRLEGSFTPMNIDACEGELKIFSRQANVTLRNLDPGDNERIQVHAEGGDILVEVDPEHCNYLLEYSTIAGSVASFVPGLDVIHARAVSAFPGGPGSGEPFHDRRWTGSTSCGRGDQQVILHADHGDIRFEPVR